jgi:hypothetical protein
MNAGWFEVASPLFEALQLRFTVSRYSRSGTGLLRLVVVLENAVMVRVAQVTVTPATLKTWMFPGEGPPKGRHSGFYDFDGLSTICSCSWSKVYQTILNWQLYSSEEEMSSSSL